MNKLQFGDFVFTLKKGNYFSSFIAWMSPSKTNKHGDWSHVMRYAGKGKLIEASVFNPIKFTHISKYLDKSKYNIAFKRYNKELTQTEIKTLSTYYHSKIGLPYSMGQNILIFLKLTFKLKIFDINVNAYECAELSSEGDLLINRVLCHKHAYENTPQDIYDSLLLSELNDVEI